MLALSIVLSGLAMYGFVRSWLGRNAGLVAAVAYMVIPYHLVDVYVPRRHGRIGGAGLAAAGAVGISGAVRQARAGRAILARPAAYAGLMWTSNLVAVIFTPALAVYVAVLIFWRCAAGQRAAERPDGVRGPLSLRP